MRKDVASSFDFNNPRLELSGITVPLRVEADDLYPLVFDLSADSRGGKKLAMNAMTNAQPWHHRLGHFNKRSLELMQRCVDNRVVFDGSIDHCDFCAVGKTSPAGSSLQGPTRRHHGALSVGLWRPDGPL